ncbi:MAG TPA: O-methyltransferase [Dermatophilaceae bacterium]|nr:O-methyltransferase [Dermatophilaceae bacterium]
MSGQKPATWAYAEQFVAETEQMEQARARGEQLGCVPVLPGVGAVLRLLAAARGARAVVEVGTGAGVSGLWLLAGMPADGILTTIDLQAEHQRAAKQAYAAAGYAPQRTRVITGRALDVLPRLTDAAYDMVVVDADKAEYPAYVQQALRLLKSGGVLAIDNMLWHDQVADPAARDEVTATLRDLGKTLRDDDSLVPALLPTGDGLFAAVKR